MAVLRTELSKQLRRPRTYVALAFPVAVPLIITFALAFGTTHLEEADPFFFFASESGLIVPAAALRSVERFVLFIVVAVVAGDAVAGEASSGNLRYLLVRPISRSRLLGAKLIVVAGFLVTATALVSLTGLVAGTIAFGFSPPTTTFGFGDFDASTGELLIRVAASTAYVAWQTAPVAAFAFMLSTITNSPAAAVGAAISLPVMSQILGAIEPLGALRDGLPTRRLDDWDDLYFFGEATHRTVEGLLIPLPYVVLFCAVAWYWFNRKDVLS
jgi:ABC-2 type transport system permease protein